MKDFAQLCLQNRWPQFVSLKMQDPSLIVNFLYIGYGIAVIKYGPGENKDDVLEGFHIYIVMLENYIIKECY